MTKAMTGGADLLVSTQWLDENLGTQGLSIVDGSWYLPAMNRDGRAEYLAGHIPGAVFFDIDAVSDRSSPLPHTLPDAKLFASAVGALGVADTDHIVVYDGGGLFSAPRVWWMLQTFGASRVSILDGGLPKWKAEGRALETGEAARPSATFNARFDASAVAWTPDVIAALETGAAQVADARAKPRFDGLAAEPRTGIPSGHMPGALNLPASALVSDGRLLPPEALRDNIAAAGIDSARPVITSCGSGVSAAIINLAFAATGLPAPRLYDGSWTEWATRGDLPIDPPPQAADRSA